MHFLVCFAELSDSIWSFSGRIWAAVCGWRESAGSDASTCGRRDSPSVQQQGQGPDGFGGEDPYGLCPSQQPCRTCWLTSARQALKKKHRNATIKWHNHGQQSNPSTGLHLSVGTSLPKSPARRRLPQTVLWDFQIYTQIRPLSKLIVWFKWMSGWDYYRLLLCILVRFFFFFLLAQIHVLCCNPPL